MAVVDQHPWTLLKTSQPLPTGTRFTGGFPCPPRLSGWRTCPGRPRAVLSLKGATLECRDEPAQNDESFRVDFGADPDISWVLSVPLETILEPGWGPSGNYFFPTVTVQVALSSPVLRSPLFLSSSSTVVRLWCSTHAVQPTDLVGDDGHRMCPCPTVQWLNTHAAEPTTAAIG